MTSFSYISFGVKHPVDKWADARENQVAENWFGDEHLREGARDNRDGIREDQSSGINHENMEMDDLAGSVVEDWDQASKPLIPAHLNMDNLKNRSIFTRWPPFVGNRNLSDNWFLFTIFVVIWLDACTTSLVNHVIPFDVCRSQDLSHFNESVRINKHPSCPSLGRGNSGNTYENRLYDNFRLTVHLCGNVSLKVRQACL